MPKSLVQTLDELVTLGPDEIVAAISDPLAQPINIADMSIELWRKLEHRRVVWFMWSERYQRWSKDTSGEYELLVDSGPDGWVGRQSRDWCITSLEYYQQCGVPKST